MRIRAFASEVSNADGLEGGGAQVGYLESGCTGRREAAISALRSTIMYHQYAQLREILAGVWVEVQHIYVCCRQEHCGVNLHRTLCEESRLEVQPVLAFYYRPLDII